MTVPLKVTYAVVSGILFGTGELMTIVRIIFRAKHRRLWYDDAWAVMAFLSSFMAVSMVFDRLIPTRSQHHMIVCYWVSSFGFQISLWSSRLSIVFAIIRLIPSQDRLRKRMKWAVIAFLAMWLGIVIQKAYLCGHDLSWQKMPGPHCPLGLPVAILELITDVVADIALAVIPVWLYRNTRLPSRQKTMVFVIFTSSLFITVASAVHAWYLLHPGGFTEGFTAGIECAVALMVANMGVVVCFVYRIFRWDMDSDSYTVEYSIGSDGRVRMRRKTVGNACTPTDVVFAPPNESDRTGSNTSSKACEPFELEDVLTGSKAQDYNSSSGISVLVQTEVETSVIDQSVKTG